MKTLLFVSLVFTWINCTAQAGDRDQILKILSAQTEAWNKGDIDLFMQMGYWKHDSLTMVGRNGVTYGYQNILNNYKKNYNDASKMGQLVFDILQVKELSADLYYVIGKWSLTRTAGDVGGHYTLLFRKIDGKWLIVSDHSS
jgi:ketosteroid isomerase-like protein